MLKARYLRWRFEMVTVGLKDRRGFDEHIRDWVQSVIEES